MTHLINKRNLWLVVFVNTMNQESLFCCICWFYLLFDVERMSLKVELLSYK